MKINIRPYLEPFLGLIFLVTAGCDTQPDTIVFHQDVSWAPDGSKLLLSRMEIKEESYTYQIIGVNPDGSSKSSLTKGPNDKWTSWSPVGDKIAYTSTVDDNSDIYIMNMDGGMKTRITNDPAIDTHPDWSPDGSKIAFISNREGEAQVFVMNIDGSEVTLITHDPGEKNNPRWSPDGNQIAFYSAIQPGQDSIYVMKADGSGMKNLGKGVWPSWSPDGNRILYMAETDAFEMNLDGSQNRLVVSNAVFARWSPDGNKIAFIRETWRAPEGWPAATALYLMNADGSEKERITE